MAEDLEVGVRLKVDDEALQNIQDQELGIGSGAGGPGGGPSPSQRNQQEGVIAGGVSRGLLAVGVFAGILSQLKSVTATVEAVFGAISRALIPVVEELADFIRPFVSQVNELASLGPRRFAEESGQQTASRAGIPIVSERENVTEEDVVNINELAVQAQNQFFSDIVDAIFGSKNADQSGEATKQDLKNQTEDAGRDRLGAQR